MDSTSEWSTTKSHLDLLMEFSQWIILVLVIGGRDYITPHKAIYTWYISGIYCQLGVYIPPTTLYRNLNNPLI